MNENVKIKIIELRNKGYGYGRISMELNIPRSSVSTFCKRNDIDNTTIDRFAVCKNCDKLIRLEIKKKNKIFCSDECRVNWWNTHQEQVNKKAIYDFVCPVCNKHFTTYGNKKQKYCSHICYIQDRYKKGRERND
ncbi:MAG: RNA polymerase subunit sigma-70 [Bacilli bacterium]|nr:RNA polymerase subunit sigma-70 [Bacilli bacterium]